ncbi:hypothetical protein BEQ56_06240 [Anaerolineaceae bacterium oral taxon 439]|nr:hypothetical protein BEQ56_06240 [Anaerolineaceae bacterium oral taxon 439]
MMKRYLFFLVVVLSVLSLLVGCAPKAEPTPEAAAPETDAKAPAASDKVWKVAMIANTPIADGGWNSACYAGMTGAAENFGFETAYSENVAQTDYVSILTEYGNMGFDLVFAPGNEFTDAVLEVAPAFPKTNFLVLNGDVKAENVMSVKADNTQMGFLAGALAGLKTRTKKVGFVGGMEITTAKQAINGYYQGVAYTNPEAEVSVSWANSWDDTAKGKEIAMSMISTNDTDVFFGTASAVDVGVREGLVEFEDRWGIAQPGESLDQNPERILTSIITDNVALVGIGLERTQAGTFGGEVIEAGVKEGVLYVGKIGESMKDVEEAFMKIFDELKAGSITIDYELK